ncbi:MAG: phosphoribosylaminoimidazolesuccinocarboxamide synthase [Lacipirellulaceae bacterium]
MPGSPLTLSHVPGLVARRGKVRDVYDLGDRVLLVATDRISAFDWVLPTAVPDKGRVLTQLSRFWFELLGPRVGIGHHLLTCDVRQMGLPVGTDLDSLDGRSMLCRKARVAPFECVARGYLAGSGWNEYRVASAVCGEPLPAGLVESDKLPCPLFTPATKAADGEHDENVPFSRVVADLGADPAGRLRQATLALYVAGADYAAGRGVIIADTKFEFGLAENTPEGELILIDEALTPDSSRFWSAAEYRPGGPQASFDKQFVRDWLLGSGWDRQSPPPGLPTDVVDRTRGKYIDAYELLTGEAFAWR